ncbi:MAG: hypothetical protein IPN53_18380 [Comamonadaceae bacterium]|nr:hypothetical protein [Comamonadaceae bacterium]
MSNRLELARQAIGNADTDIVVIQRIMTGLSVSRPAALRIFSELRRQSARERQQRRNEQTRQ